MSRRKHQSRLPAPFLRRLWVLADKLPLARAYPFTLDWMTDPGFEVAFEQPVTILVGENGCGKSTFIEAVAALAGFGPGGGGNGYGAVSDAGARESSGAPLAEVLRAGWLPKVTRGWFFRAETFFSVARYLDAAGSPSADFLSHSHGEGFLRFFDERVAQQGIYFLDEPESALSPHRQLDLLRHLTAIQRDGRAQVIMATHAPLLMAVPGAALWQITRGGPAPVRLEDTPHFRLMRAFCADPDGVVRAALDGDEGLLA